MRPKKVGLPAAFMLLVVIAAIAQEPAPGSMQLLPGFQHQHKQGVDSTVGTISKPGGLRIDYDIGEWAGDYTKCTWCG